MDVVIKPDFCTDAQLAEYLDDLDDIREEGFVNMFGAVPYLKADFPELTDGQARLVHSFWMATFSERHPK